MRWLKFATVFIVVLTVLLGAALYYFAWHHDWRSPADAPDPFAEVYLENCAVCHGDQMEGEAQGPALVGNPLKYGESVAALTAVIAEGIPQTLMSGWVETLDSVEIRRLAIYIAESGKS